MNDAPHQPLPPAWGQPWAWLVTTGDGWRAVFIDHATADKYAAANHGSVTPLYPRQ